MTRRYEVPAKRVEKEVHYLLGSLAATMSERPVFIAPTNCEILSSHFVNVDAITASDTNYWTFALTNKGATGTGTSAVASVTTKTSVSGGSGDILAFDAQSLGTITNGLLTKGDVVTSTVTKAATATTLASAVLTIRYREI